MPKLRDREGAFHKSSSMNDVYLSSQCWRNHQPLSGFLSISHINLLYDFRGGRLLSNLVIRNNLTWDPKAFLLACMQSVS